MILARGSRAGAGCAVICTCAGASERRDVHRNPDPRETMDWISSPEMWLSLATLTVIEIGLGIDNIVFISILTNKLPKDQQAKARYLGLGLAMVMRIILLFSLTWVMRLTDPLFAVLD